jgi:hypothetical protein
MRTFDTGVGTCQEDMLTQRWLEDPPPYVRLDGRYRDRNRGEREKGERGKEGKGVERTAERESPSRAAFPLGVLSDLEC